MAPVATTNAGFARVGQMVRTVGFDVPEAERQALSQDIEAQLAGLPTAIGDPDTYRKAKESLPVLKRAEDKIVAFFKDIKDAAFKAHRAITTKEAEQLKPVTLARTKLSNLIYGYEQEQQRERRDREREAARLEQQRQHDEALAQAASMSTDEPEMAAQVLEEALAAPAPVVALPSTTVEVAGVSSAENWQFKYTGCASGVEWDKLPDADRQRVLRLMPREYLRPDEKAIGKVVKAMKGGTKIPGIEAHDIGSMRTRG